MMDMKVAADGVPGALPGAGEAVHYLEDVLAEAIRYLDGEEAAALVKRAQDVAEGDQPSEAVAQKDAGDGRMPAVPRPDLADPFQEEVHVVEILVEPVDVAADAAGASVSAQVEQVALIAGLPELRDQGRIAAGVLRITVEDHHDGPAVRQQVMLAGQNQAIGRLELRFQGGHGLLVLSQEFSCSHLPLLYLRP
jgi:hypothetical protein